MRETLCPWEKYAEHAFPKGIIVAQNNTSLIKREVSNAAKVRINTIKHII